MWWAEPFRTTPDRSAVPSVPVELLLARYEIANRPGRQCVVNTLLAEQKRYGFDLIYAATQRICALTEALQSSDLDLWLVSGTPYYAVGERPHRRGIS
jgi:hypothetical protein